VFFYLTFKVQNFRFGTVLPVTELIKATKSSFKIWQKQTLNDTEAIALNSIFCKFLQLFEYVLLLVLCIWILKFSRQVWKTILDSN